MQTLRVERRQDLAVLRLDKARGNAIDARLLEDLMTACRELADDRAVRGVLLASVHPKLFCPGLDLVTLVDYDRPAFERFMARFGEVMRALYGLRKPVVAAVSGHAVAGGCILALTADWRVLARGAQIGLNEVRIGVPLPWSVSVMLRAALPPTSLARVALLGRNFSDAEALEVGLADGLAEAEGFEAACLTRLREFADRNPLALGATKAYLRAPALSEMEAREHELLPEFVSAWFSEPAQRWIRQTVASLAAKG